MTTGSLLLPTITVVWQFMAYNNDTDKVDIAHEIHKEQLFELTDAAGQRCCILNPKDPFRIVWDIWQIVFLFYVAAVVPLRLGFDVPTEVRSATWWFELIVDVYFIVDFLVRSCYGHYCASSLIYAAEYAIPSAACGLPNGFLSAQYKLCRGVCAADQLSLVLL